MKRWTRDEVHRENCCIAQRLRRAGMSPEARANERRRHLLAEYGLTPPGWRRLIERQNGQCFICDATYYEEGENGFFRLNKQGNRGKWLHLDIDHEPGCKKNVRALLCQSCNARVRWYEYEGKVDPAWEQERNDLY